MSTRTNLATNPSATSAVTNWTAGAGTGGAAGIAYQSGLGYAGSGFARVTWTTATSDASGGIKYTKTGLSAATTYSFRIAVRPSKTQLIAVIIQYQNSTPTIVNTVASDSKSCPANVWTVFTVDGAVSGTGVDRVEVYAKAVTGGSAWAIGDKLDGDAMLIEQASTAGSYFDGDSHPWAVWTGTANASTSTLYVPTITLTPYVDDSPCPRVEVLITDLAPSVFTITGTRFSGKRSHLVRGLVQATVAGSISRLDFEVPFNVAAQYRVETFDAAGVSIGFSDTAEITVAVPATDTYVHNPLNPGGAVRCDLLATSGSTITRPIDGEVIYPRGRTVGVVVSHGRRGIVGIPLFVSTLNLIDADRFSDLLGSYSGVGDVPVLCIRSGSGLRIPKPFFCAVLNPQEMALDVAQGGEVIDWDISGDEASPPTPGIFVPLLSRADLNAYYSTRSALNGDNATRLTVNRRFDLGGFDS